MGGAFAMHAADPGSIPGLIPAFQMVHLCMPGVIPCAAELGLTPEHQPGVAQQIPPNNGV